MYNYFRAEIYRVRQKPSVVFGLGVLSLLFFLIMLFFELQIHQRSSAPTLMLSEYRELGLTLVFSGPIYIYPIFLQSVYMDDIQYKTAYRAFGQGISRAAYIMVKFLILSLLAFVFYALISLAYMVPLFHLAGRLAPLSFYWREMQLILWANFVRMSSLIVSVSVAAVFAFRCRQRMLPYAVGLLVIYYLPYLFFALLRLAMPGAEDYHLALAEGFFLTQARFMVEKGKPVSRPFFVQTSFFLLLALLGQYRALARRKNTSKGGCNS